MSNFKYKLQSLIISVKASYPNSMQDEVLADKIISMLREQYSLRQNKILKNCTCGKDEIHKELVSEYDKLKEDLLSK